jgi:hypothetical protein
MYWIYLILFVLAIFTPDIINRDFPFLEEERMEELVIFILGATAFFIFLAKEKQLYRIVAEKLKIQKEASLASKDLRETYSYIGEVNRKIDILKDIAFKITGGPAITPEKETEIYRSIIHAVQMFTRSENASLLFINTKNGKTVKEIKSGKKTKCELINKEMIAKNTNFLETEETFYIRSPKSIGDFVTCVGVEKRNKSQKIDDPDLIKALASQALFLFTFLRKEGGSRV